MCIEIEHYTYSERLLIQMLYVSLKAFKIDSPFMKCAAFKCEYDGNNSIKAKILIEKKNEREKNHIRFFFD